MIKLDDITRGLVPPSIAIERSRARAQLVNTAEAIRDMINSERDYRAGPARMVDDLHKIAAEFTVTHNNDTDHAVTVSLSGIVVQSAPVVYVDFPPSGDKR